MNISRLGRADRSLVGRPKVPSRGPSRGRSDQSSAAASSPTAWASPASRTPGRAREGDGGVNPPSTRPQLAHRRKAWTCLEYLLPEGRRSPHCPQSRARRCRSVETAERSPSVALHAGLAWTSDTVSPCFANVDEACRCRALRHSHHTPGRCRRRISATRRRADRPRRRPQCQTPRTRRGSARGSIAPRPRPQWW